MKTLKSSLCAAAFMATVLALLPGAHAADTTHEHGRGVSTSVAGASAKGEDQPEAERPMPASAEDMLRAMETTPTHDDHDACCRARKAAPAEHDHGH